MTNFDFSGELRINRFSNSNDYAYHPLTNTNLRFYKDCPNYPFIMTSGWQNDPTILVYSSYAYQLRSRLLNTAKIKEVMNSAAIPLMFRIREKWYLIGKGFLAHVVNATEFTESIKLLFVACIDSSGARINSISDVRFFVSKDIYKEDYKAVLPAIKDLMQGHTGDVIMTGAIEDRIGDKIVFPTRGTLKDRQDYKQAIMLECIKDYFG